MADVVLSNAGIPRGRMPVIMEARIRGGLLAGGPSFHARRAWPEHAGLPLPLKESDLTVDADVTQILQRLNRGEKGAVEELLRCIYEELHRLAQNHMRGQRPENTLQPTA